MIVIYTMTGLGLACSLARDPDRTAQAMRWAGRILVRLLPPMLAVVGLVGIIVGALPPAIVSRYLGAEAGLAGTMLAATTGAIMLIPSLVAFPLAGSVLQAGAGVMTIAAFITTLTMVGVVTAPLEARELGVRFTVVRNLLAFGAALVIALSMGVILS